MKPYIIKVAVITFITIMTAILLGPLLYHRPLDSKAELVFFNATEVDAQTVNYEDLSAKAVLTYIKTDQGNLIELEIFENALIEDLYLDLNEFIDVMKEINHRSPWDIRIIETDSMLEITFHARFNNQLFYTQQTIILSKAFNLLVPFTGGITIEGLSPSISYSFFLGTMAARINFATTSYENPFVVTLLQSQDVTITTDGYFKGKHVLFYPNETLDYDLETAVIETYLII